MSKTYPDDSLQTSEARVEALKEIYDAAVIADNKANTTGFYVQQFFVEILRALPVSATDLDLNRLLNNVLQNR